MKKAFETWEDIVKEFGKILTDKPKSSIVHCARSLNDDAIRLDLSDGRSLILMADSTVILHDKKKWPNGISILLTDGLKGSLELIEDFSAVGEIEDLVYRLGEGAPPRGTPEHEQYWLKIADAFALCSANTRKILEGLPEEDDHVQ